MPANRSSVVTARSGHCGNPHFRYTSAAHQKAMRRPQVNPHEIPNYTIEESARYLHVPYEKVNYWVVGGENIPPLTTVFTRRPMLLSFKNLVECFVLESLRKIHGVSLQSIRESVLQLRIARASKYPLADYDLHTEGGKLIYLDEQGQQLTCLTRSGQMVFRDIVMP